MSFDVDVSLRRGDGHVRCAFVAGEGATVLFGPSGVGKTSVLDMVAGLLRPDRGHVRVGGRTLFGDGVDVPPERRGAGYVFQEGRLFPHMRVRANLLYGARDDVRLEGARLEGARLATTAAMLDVAHLLDRWPRTLSGGEARRVAIGRALLSDARFLLLDEPLASLDAVRAAEATRAILRVRDETGLPILLVTHDAGEAERIGNRVVAMPSIS
jgi:molybdate transport system ATP-binding protein